MKKNLSQNTINDIYKICKKNKLHISYTDLNDLTIEDDDYNRFVEKLDWKTVGALTDLSEDFIREFQDKIGWDYVSSNQDLSEEFIREFKDKIDWEYISSYQKLSEEFIREFKDKVDWCWVSMHQKLSEDFIREFADKLDFLGILNNQKLSEEFKKEFKLLKEGSIPKEKKMHENTIADIKKICEKSNIQYDETLSEDFIKTFKDDVNWCWLSTYKNLSEDFIREFADCVNWIYISEAQNLSENFIREFKDRVSWDKISKHQILSENFIREFKYKVDLNNILQNQKLSESSIRKFQNSIDWCYLCPKSFTNEIFVEFKDKIRSQVLHHRYIYEFSWNNQHLLLKNLQEIFNEKVASDIKTICLKKKVASDIKTICLKENLQFDNISLEEFVNKLDWIEISETKLSEDFLKFFKDKLDWKVVSRTQTLSEAFINEFEKKVCWYWICRKQKLSENFIKNNITKIDWIGASFNQILSEGFINEYQDKVDWVGISCNQKLSEKFILDHHTKVHWQGISIHQKLSEDTIEEFKSKVFWKDIFFYQNLSMEFMEKYKTYFMCNNLRGINITNPNLQEFCCKHYPELAKQLMPQKTIYQTVVDKAVEDIQKQEDEEFVKAIDKAIKEEKEKEKEKKLISKDAMDDIVRLYTKYGFTSTNETDCVKFFKEKMTRAALINISIQEKLSEDFIRLFQDYVSWTNISACQKLSEEFIMEFKDKVNWDYIAFYQDVSKEFMEKNKQRINWDSVIMFDFRFSKNPNLTKEFVQNMIGKENMPSKTNQQEQTEWDNFDEMVDDMIQYVGIYGENIIQFDDPKNQKIGYISADESKSWSINIRKILDSKFIRADAKDQNFDLYKSRQKILDMINGKENEDLLSEEEIAKLPGISVYDFNISVAKKCMDGFVNIQSKEYLEEHKDQILGKNGFLNDCLKLLKDMPAEKRKAAGKEINEIKEAAEKAYQERLKNLEGKSLITYCVNDKQITLTKIEEDAIRSQMIYTHLSKQQDQKDVKLELFSNDKGNIAYDLTKEEWEDLSKQLESKKSNYHLTLGNPVAEAFDKEAAKITCRINDKEFALTKDELETIGKTLQLTKEDLENIMFKPSDKMIDKNEEKMITIPKEVYKDICDICEKCNIEWDKYKYYMNKTVDIKESDYLRFKNLDKDIWNGISCYQTLSETFIRTFQNEVNWYNISNFQNLSEEFIREFINDINPVFMRSQILSEKFIEEFQDIVDWQYISQCQKLSEEFISKFQDKINWLNIALYQNISQDFLENNKDKIDWEIVLKYSILSKNPNLTKEFIMKQIKPTFISQTKSDATKAAYRIAGKQITKGTKAAILKLIKNENKDITMAEQLLDTEFGNALVSAVIGYSLTYAPKISEDERVQKLAAEFRINGIATAGNNIVDIVTDNIVPVIDLALTMLPNKTDEKFRADDPANDIVVDEICQEQTVEDKTQKESC